MKNKINLFLILLFLFFIFLVFFKGLNNTNLYKPKGKIKDIPEFSTITFFKKEKISSKEIFDEKKYYLFNIWASWCLPCRDEHQFLSKLSDIDNFEIIGLNYKDKFKNAKQFLDELSNPYNLILIDRDGTRSIEWGAIGVPESFLIYNNKIIKKFVGPLNGKSIQEIETFLK